MNILKHAKNELDAIGMTENCGDDMNILMRRHILHMAEEFSKEQHSGFSASYAVTILAKLLRFEPLSPLTGSKDEWLDVSEYGVKPSFQNVRCSRIFKDSEESPAYDVAGIIWYDFHVDEITGKNVKSFFTNSKSSTTITFPYTPTQIESVWIEEEN
jgi:hypothetical protein